MSEPVELDAGVEAGLDAFRKQQASGGVVLERDAAVKIIVRDWLQGQGFMPLPGESKHKTAAKAAGVPLASTDP